MSILEDCCELMGLPQGEDIPKVFASPRELEGLIPSTDFAQCLSTVFGRTKQVLKKRREKGDGVVLYEFTPGVMLIGIPFNPPMRMPVSRISVAALAMTLMCFPGEGHSFLWDGEEVDLRVLRNGAPEDWILRGRVPRAPRVGTGLYSLVESFRFGIRKASLAGRI